MFEENRWKLWVLGSLGVVVFFVCGQMSVRAGEEASDGEEWGILRSALKERADAFENGKMHVQEVNWVVNADKFRDLQALGALMSLQILSEENAYRLSLQLLQAMEVEFGPGQETRWEYLVRPDGAKVVQREESGKVEKMNGYLDGVMVWYDLDRGQLMMSETVEVDKLLFHHSMVDPTLRGALMMGPDAEKNSIQMRVFEDLIEVRGNEFVHKLRKTENGDLLVEEVSKPGEMDFSRYGNYSRVEESARIAPYCGLHVEEGKEGNLNVRLWVVQSWRVGEVENQDLLIRVPADTNIIQDWVDHF